MSKYAPHILISFSSASSFCSTCFAESFALISYFFFKNHSAIIIFLPAFPCFSHHKICIHLYLYSVCTWSHPVTNLVLLAFFPYSLFLLALFISVHLSHLSASLLAQRVRCEASQLASLPVSLLSQSNGSELHLHPVQSAPSL